MKTWISLSYSSLQRRKNKKLICLISSQVKEVSIYLRLRIHILIDYLRPIYEKIYALSYTDEPDYDEYESMLFKILEKQNLVTDWIFDWANLKEPLQSSNTPLVDQKRMRSASD